MSGKHRTFITQGLSEDKFMLECYRIMCEMI